MWAHTDAATLYVSEIGFAGEDNTVDVSGTPHHGSYSLRAGFSPDPFAMGVGGGRSGQRADMGLAGHTVVEGFCHGLYDARTHHAPDLARQWRAALHLCGERCGHAASGSTRPMVAGGAMMTVRAISIPALSSMMRAMASTTSMSPPSRPGETSTATVYISQNGLGRGGALHAR